VEWEGQEFTGKKLTRLHKTDILEFKHLINWIVWYKFTVGSQFTISFKLKNSKEVSIQFNSYFGLHKENSEKYSHILDDIWKLYHSDIVHRFLDNFYECGKVEIQGTKLQVEGIVLPEGGLVPWDKVAMKDYHRYFAIYHRDDSNIHCRITLDAYGAETLWSAIRAILKERERNPLQLL